MCKSSHPNPTIEFFDINCLLHSIDDVDSNIKNDPLANYDESESESESDNDNQVNPQVDQSVVARKRPTFTPSAYLPNDDDEIDLASTELEEALIDKPLPKKGKVVMMSPMDGAESEQEDEEGSFELASWV